MAMIEFGRLLRSDATRCVVGCWVSQLTVPILGGLVSIHLNDDYQVFGIIHNIQVDDDGFVRQLLSANHLDEDVIMDNRLNRHVPVEIGVLYLGYQQQGIIYHLLPPRPPLILDAIYPCSDEEISRFSSEGHFGYFRHLLRATDLPVGELLASHIRQAGLVHEKNKSSTWIQTAAQELIILLRDDYNTLMHVLGALSDSHLDFSGIS